MVAKIEESSKFKMINISEIHIFAFDDNLLIVDYFLIKRNLLVLKKIRNFVLSVE